jgi:hypothetical protein
MRFDLEKYETVEARLDRFWSEHPGGRIETRLLTPAEVLEEVVVSAAVWFDVTEEHPRATGLASERRGGQGANQIAHLENCETSAIGRALANAGYKARKDAPRPSREEMGKGDRQAPDSRGDAQAATDHATAGKGEREDLIHAVHGLFKALHEGEKFYPWAGGILKRPVTGVSDLEYADMRTLHRHLSTEKAVMEGQARQGGAPPPDTSALRQGL